MVFSCVRDLFEISIVGFLSFVLPLSLSLSLFCLSLSLYFLPLCLVCICSSIVSKGEGASSADLGGLSGSGSLYLPTLPPPKGSIHARARTPVASLQVPARVHQPPTNPLPLNLIPRTVDLRRACANKAQPSAQTPHRVSDETSPHRRQTSSAGIYRALNL